MKKEFCLNALREYVKDPSKCGIDGKLCSYLTPKGNKCVAGKFLVDPSNKKFVGRSIDSLLREYGEEIFIPEARGILSIEKWHYLQRIHDGIAHNAEMGVRKVVLILNLFTYEELMDLKN